LKSMSARAIRNAGRPGMAISIIHVLPSIVPYSIGTRT
jgi:hypothetical protein